MQKKIYVIGRRNPDTGQGIYELKGLVSRKKQLIPLLAELVVRCVNSY